MDISRETYLAVLMDRAFNGPVLVGSPDGGMDIEEVAEKTPERIFTMPIDIIDGINMDQAMEMAANLNFTGDNQKTAAEQIIKLYNLFIAVDASQVILFDSYNLKTPYTIFEPGLNSQTCQGLLLLLNIKYF